MLLGIDTEGEDPSNRRYAIRTNDDPHPPKQFVVLSKLRELFRSVPTGRKKVPHHHWVEIVSGCAGGRFGIESWLGPMRKEALDLGVGCLIVAVPCSDPDATVSAARHAFRNVHDICLHILTLHLNRYFPIFIGSSNSAAEAWPNLPYD
jgi:hypothetical protein